MLGPSGPGSVSLEGVSRAFSEARVLRQVDLRLKPGAVTEIIGANGAGKTSLLRILAGTLAPDSGRALVCGSAPGRGAAAFVPAGDRASYWRLTALQELEFFARLGGAGRRSAKRLATDAVEAFALQDFASRQIGTLSTGQRRRLMVARSLVGRAPVLLLDEPYADLDEGACDLVQKSAHSWAADGGVVLWTAPSDGGGPTPSARLRLTDGRLEDA